MRSSIMRLLAVPAGEGRQTLLLYSLHLLFYIGLFWGEQASEALFLSSWGPNNLAITFVGTAVLSLLVAAVYLPLADRWSNERMLQAMTLGLIVWLVSIRLLLAHAGSGRSPVYPYFYVVYSTARDLSTLVILNYINDFYDTRAAKRAIPLMLSAAVAGSAIAGFSNPLLGATIGVANVPLAWIVCLGAAFVLVRYIGTQFRPGTATAAQTDERSTLAQRLQFVRGSALLRWMTVATFAMVVLMRLLNYEASRVFVAHFAHQPQALFNFYGLFGGTVSVFGFLLQSLLVGRLIGWLGVAEMYALFPAIALAAAGLLGVVPNFATAIGGRLTHTVLKQSFRNPLDALIFNSVPVRLKNGAKALVNGVVVPLGILAAGLVLIGVDLFHLPVSVVTAIAIAVALVYLAASWKVKGEYRHALADLVAGGTVLSYLERADLTDFERPDPALKPMLERYIAEEQSEAMVAFLAGLFYELWGRDAIATLRGLLETRGPSVRRAVVELLGRDFAAEASMRDLLLAALRDADARVRHAAASALGRVPDLTRDARLLAALRALLREEHEAATRAAALAALLRAPQTRTCAEVMTTLAEWASAAAGEQERLLALDALAAADDPRAVALLHEAAASASAATRLRAVLAARTASGQDNLLRAEKLAILARAGSDAEPAIRRAAVETLGGWGAQATPALIAALGDADDDVRRQACLALPRSATDRVATLLKDGDPLQRQSAAYILVRAGEHGARAQLLAVVDELAACAYAISALSEPLRTWQTPAAYVLQATVAERVQQAALQVVWLLSALSSEQATQGIALGLLSENAITRSNAGEALEALTSPRLARWLAPLLRGESESATPARSHDADSSRDLLTALWPRLRGSAAPDAVSASGLLDADGWLTALTIITATELERSEVTGDELRPALESALDDPRVNVRNATRVALDRSEAATSGERRDATMLSAIEKAIFLKGVPLFDTMPIDQIRALVGISEEANYVEQQAIFSESEPGDCLFVVVSGRVAVQQRAGRRRDSIVRLATLGPREYFGENALFDAAPRDADAVALEPTQTLTVRRGPFVEVIRQYPHLALDLLGVFSQRLRDANSTIAAKTAARPKELVSLYDKF